MCRYPPLSLNMERVRKFEVVIFSDAEDSDYQTGVVLYYSEDLFENRTSWTRWSRRGKRREKRRRDAQEQRDNRPGTGDPV